MSESWPQEGERQQDYCESQTMQGREKGATRNKIRCANKDLRRDERDRRYPASAGIRSRTVILLAP